MQLFRKPRSTPSSPKIFQTILLGSKLKHNVNSCSISPSKIQSSKCQDQFDSKPRPLPCNFKSQSLEHKLSLFFHKKRRPRPRTLVPRSIDQLLRKQLLFPQIQCKREGQTCQTLQFVDLNENYTQIAEIRQVSKTVVTEQSQTISKLLKSVNKKQIRRQSIRRSKKNTSKQEMFTKQGWRSENKQKWLFGMTKIFE